MPLKTLIEFGLSEKEAKIYIALLELEVAKISDIARKTGINRSSAYVILEELKKKELATVSLGGNGVQQYVASSPDVLLLQVEEKTKKQENLKEKIKKAMPELKALHKDTKNRPRVYVYEGREAIENAFYGHDIFTEQSLMGMRKLRVYENMADVKKFVPPDFIKNDVSLLKKTGTKMYVISPDNKDARSVINEYQKFGSRDEFAIIPERKFSQTGTSLLSFTIYENYIEFFSQDSFVVAIENKEIADVLKNVFDMAWVEAIRLDKGNKRVQ